MPTSGITVGAVNVLAHSFGLLTVFIIGIIAKRCLRLSTMLQLRATGSAPIAYATFTSFVGVFRAFKLLTNNISPSRAVLVILIFLCIPAEIMVDYGVDVSEKCRPVRFRTFGLCAAPLKPNFNFATAGTIFHHTTEWDDKQLTEYPIYQGVRWEINGKEYFGPDTRRNLSLPIVLQGCSVKPRGIARGTVTFTLYFGGDLIEAGYAGVINVRIDNVTVASKGLVNLNRQKPILVASNSTSAHGTGFDATLFEYFDWRHLKTELAKLNPRMPVITFVAKSPMVTTALGCEKTGLEPAHFDAVIRAGRFAVLEHDPIKSTFIDGDLQVAALQQLTNPELVRAVLSFKFCYGQKCEGETFEYTHCGYYNIYYALPLLSIFATFLLWLVVLEARSWHLGSMTEIPINAKEWYRFFEKSMFKAGEVIKRSSHDPNITGKLTRRGRVDVAKYELAAGEPVRIVRDSSVFNSENL